MLACEGKCDIIGLGFSGSCTLWVWVSIIRKTEYFYMEVVSYVSISSRNVKESKSGTLCGRTVQYQ